MTNNYRIIEEKKQDLNTMLLPPNVFHLAMAGAHLGVWENVLVARGFYCPGNLIQNGRRKHIIPIDLNKVTVSPFWVDKKYIGIFGEVETIAKAWYYCKTGKIMRKTDRPRYWFIGRTTLAKVD